MTLAKQPDSAGRITESPVDGQVTKLGSVAFNRTVAERIQSEIEDYTATVYDDGFRWHLGASVIGSECKRMLWYGFRWVMPTKKSGRMQRLFNRGHLEEARHAEWLRGIGFTVWTHDESITKPDGTHPQLRIANLCKGHFGGAVDGVVQFPERYKINGYAILESKTSGTGAKFNSLPKDGLAKAKPQHYAQNSIYGKSFNVKHVLYICANKNDDDLYIEVANLDFKLAEQMEAKAESIIFSQEPLAKLSENPTFMFCKNMCDYKDVCHFQKPAVVNCRSCKHCSPVENAEFFCAKWAGVIPCEEVYKGCPEWVTILPITVGKVAGKKAPFGDFVIGSDVPY